MGFVSARIIFSSSATVYGASTEVPLVEGMPLGATNPYGRTKLFIEEILRDLYLSDNSWGIAILRYFNPIGAHESGNIGEDPKGIPNNLMPYIAQVAVGKLEKLHVFGDDYNTKDGTGVRDYIHVTDLAQAHILAVKYLMAGNESNIFNLGNGVGFTVKEVIEMAEKVTRQSIKLIETDRRAGDPAVLIASSSKAKQVLKWNPIREDIEVMIKDAWTWELNKRY